jgi:hypothetical protein
VFPEFDRGINPARKMRIVPSSWSQNALSFQTAYMRKIGYELETKINLFSLSRKVKKNTSGKTIR